MGDLEGGGGRSLRHAALTIKPLITEARFEQPTDSAVMRAIRLRLRPQLPVPSVGISVIPVHPFPFGMLHVPMTHMVAHGLKEVLTLSSSPRKHNAASSALSLHLRAALDVDPCVCCESKHGPLYTRGRRTPRCCQPCFSTRSSCTLLLPETISIWPYFSMSGHQDVVLQVTLPTSYRRELQGK